MNILLLTTHLEIGGIPVYTVNLARALAARGIGVFVASGPGALADSVKKEKGITFIGLDLRTKNEFSPRVFVSALKLAGIVKKFNIDVIHAQTRVSQVAACVASRLTAVPYVATCHGFFNKKRLGRRLFPCWGHLSIGISEAVCRQLTGDFGIPPAKVRLVYNGVDFERFCSVVREEEITGLKREMGIGSKSLVLGSIGRLSPVKGFRYLVLAMKDILKDRPDARLLLVGEGPSKDELVNLARELGIAEKVVFSKGSLDTRPLLSAMDIFAFPSVEEGLGISLLEALATGRPCVASDVGGISSIIKNEVTGLLVPSRDPAALKDAILRLASDSALKASVARNGRDLVRERFTLAGMAEKTAEIYREAQDLKLKSQSNSSKPKTFTF